MYHISWKDIHHSVKLKIVRRITITLMLLGKEKLCLYGSLKTDLHTKKKKKKSIFRHTSQGKFQQEIVKQMNYHSENKFWFNQQNVICPKARNLIFHFSVFDMICHYHSIVWMYIIVSDIDSIGSGMCVKKVFVDFISQCIMQLCAVLHDNVQLNVWMQCVFKQVRSRKKSPTPKNLE